ncbi:hypothetical protein GYMLUDRAFT_42364 [Collybiopsis luxurians FD-317 M1]|uniref:Uncharacterized protein n=1 Tax=Collybiopsis luxurians FD-317 M1 TaxID=944289 RepID=A0A0D0CRR7_9AGAR|nr:hypothetical protein GYMLUDRAFT_42364 [Collybiopsis luxurians FD-317 M1]
MSRPGTPLRCPLLPTLLSIPHVRTWHSPPPPFPPYYFSQHSWKLGLRPRLPNIWVLLAKDQTSRITPNITTY